MHQRALVFFADLKQDAIRANVVTKTMSQKKPEVRLYFESSGAVREIHGAIMSLKKCARPVKPKPIAMIFIVSLVEIGRAFSFSYLDTVTLSSSIADVSAFSICRLSFVVQP